MHSERPEATTSDTVRRSLGSFGGEAYLEVARFTDHDVPVRLLLGEGAASAVVLASPNKWVLRLGFALECGHGPLFD